MNMMISNTAEKLSANCQSHVLRTMNFTVKGKESVYSHISHYEPYLNGKSTIQTIEIKLKFILLKMKVFTIYYYISKHEKEIQRTELTKNRLTLLVNLHLCDNICDQNKTAIYCKTATIILKEFSSK